MDFTRSRTAINRRKATYEDSELTRNSLTNLIERIHDSGERQRRAWGMSSYLKSMLRNRAMGESCLTLSPNHRLEPPQPRQAANLPSRKRWLTRAWIAPLSTSMPAASLRALLENAIDYAGLFPPAGLALDPALRNQAGYVRSPDRWMLGAFVLPIGKFAAAQNHLAEFEPEHPLRISA